MGATNDPRGIENCLKKRHSALFVTGLLIGIISPEYAFPLRVKPGRVAVERAMARPRL
jgi:hypothetical protein